MFSSLYKELDNKIVVVHKGDIGALEGIEDFHEINLENRNDIISAITERYKISTFPCIICYGKVFSIQETQKVKELQIEKQNKEFEYAKEAIKNNKRVIFIKGKPSSPMCRFTKELINLLEQEGLTEKDYISIDILGSEKIRSEMKIYSDWPTYPQVYIDQEFVGGLDVLKEEKRKGTLSAYLKISQK